MAIEAGSVEIPIRARLDQFERDLARVKAQTGQFDSTATRAMRNVDNAVQGLTSSVNRLVAAYASFEGLKRATQTLAQFGQEMSTVRAITGATAGQFADLTAEATRLGATTRFSASQAAEGMAFLARAGFDTSEALEATAGTLRLAQAGALDLGSAADIASNILTGFRLEVEQTARVVDVLAFTANNANTNVFQLGEAMKFVAPVAAGLGVSIEEAAAAIAALSDAGLQGSLAGTGLRRVLSELESPSTKTRDILASLGVTVEEVRVSQVGLTAAMQRLAQAGVDTGTALEIFGDRGGPAFEVLSSSIPRVQELTASLDGAAGTAERIATVMDENLNGALLAVASATEAVILAFGEVQGSSLENAFRGTADVLRLVANNADIVAGAATGLATAFVATRIAGLASTQAFRAYAASVALIGPAAATANVALTALRATMSAMLGPLGVAIALAGSFAVASGVMSANAERAEQAAREQADAQERLNEQLRIARDLARERAGNANDSDAQSFADAARAAQQYQDELNGISAAARQAKIEAVSAAREQVSAMEAQLAIVQEQAAAWRTYGETVNDLSREERENLQELENQAVTLSSGLQILRRDLEDLYDTPAEEFQPLGTPDAINESVIALRSRLQIVEQESELQRRIVSAFQDANLALDDQSENARQIRDLVTEIYQIEERRRNAERAAEDAQRRLDALEGLQAELDQRERLLEALREGQDAYRDMEAVVEAENFARSNGIAIGSQQYQTVLDLVRAMRDLQRETDDYTEAQERANDVMDKAKERSIELTRELQESADQISDDIIDAFSRGWEDGLDRVAEMIRRWALENLIFEPIIRPIIQGAMGVPGAGGINFGGGLFGGGQGGGFGGLGSIFSNMNALGGRLGQGLGGFMGNTAINMGAGAGTAGFLSNAGYNLGASAPTSLITGSILSAFGMNGAGGTGQAIADTIAGAIGQSVAGPIGAAIATALSRAVGGLFKDEDYPYARSDIRIVNGQAQIVGGETLDGGNLDAVNNAAQGIADAINSALGAIGASGSFGGGTTFGTASGRSAALGSGFFAGSGGGFAGGATFTNIKDAEDAAARAVAFALAQAVGEGAIDLPEIMGNQFNAAMRIFEQNAFDIDKSIADLNFAQNFENALDALTNAALDYSDTIEGAARQQVQAAIQPLRDFIATTERLGLGTERAEAAVQSYLEALINGTSQDQLNPAEQALMALNAQFAAIREVAEEFGLSLDQVDEGLARATQQLREGFLQAVQDQVYQLEGRGFITQGQGVVSQFQSDLAQAQSLGVDPTLLIRRALLDLQRLAENLDADQLEDFANNLGELPTELQGASSALIAAAQDLREWQVSVDSARAAVDAATQAQSDAERQLDATRDAIEAQIRAEELRAEMLRANADLAQSAFDALASALQAATQDRAASLGAEISALQDASRAQQQNAADRIRQLKDEASALIRVGDAISSFAAGLTFSNLSPVSILDQFGQAQSQFNTLLQGARAGDAEAASGLTDAAQTLLQLNAQINRSGVAGSSLFQSVQEQLSSVGVSLTGRGERLDAEAQAQVERLDSLIAANDNQIAELEALRQSARSDSQEQINELAALLGISTDGFDGVRSAIFDSIQAAVANGQTFEQYLAANQTVFDALGNQDFDFAQFASEAFQRAAESFALSEERQAQIEAAEVAYNAASETLSNASQALEAVLSAGPGIQGRFNELLNNISAGGTQVEDALAGLSNAITGAAADFNTRVDEVLNNDIQPVVDEIRGLRNDAQAAADRSARIEAGILDAVERNFRSDQPVILGGVRLQA